MIQIIDITTGKKITIESDKVKIEDVLAALQLVEKLDLEL